jgi:hypothetical protein
MSRGILISAVVVALVAGAAFATPTVTYNLSLNAVYTNDSITTPVALSQSQLANAAVGSLPVGYDYDLQVTATVTGMDAGANVDNFLAQPFATNSLTLAPSTSVACDVAGTSIDYSPYSGYPNVTVGKTSYAYFYQNAPTGTPVKYAFAAFLAPVAQKADPADGTPIILGDIWVNWDGTAPVLETIGGAAGFNNFSTWEANTTGAGTALAYGISSSPGGIETIISNGVQFGAVPEPATMSLLVLGGIGALLRRRK